MEDLILYSSNIPFSIKDFEEAFHTSKRQYSIFHLKTTGDISDEHLIDAIEKVEQICHLAGICGKQHFQKIYVYEAENQSVHIDYRMSRSAFNLLLMQLPQLNENRAKWLWELAGG